MDGRQTAQEPRTSWSRFDSESLVGTSFKLANQQRHWGRAVPEDREREARDDI